MDEQVLATPVLRDDLVLRQFVAHAIRVGILAIDLVDGDDERHTRRLRVLDGLDGLRHDAVIRGHDQHDDIGRLGAARAHRRERGVTGCIEERDPAFLALHRVGADMLRDAAGFRVGHVSPPNVIQQRGLAVVDMTHDGDHGRPRDLLARLYLLFREQLLVDVLGRDRLGDMTEFLDHQRGGVLVDNLVDRHHRAHVEEHLDDLVALDGHALREFRYRDALGDLHLAHDGRGGLLETVLRVAADRHGAAPHRRLALAAAALVAGHVQFLAAVTGFGALGLGFALLFLFFLGAPGAGVFFRFLEARLFLGLCRRDLLGRLAGLFLGVEPLFFLLLPLLFLETRGLFLLGLQALLLALFRFETLFFLATLAIELLLLLLGLLLEHVALDVGPLAADLDVDRARTTLRAGKLELRLRLALERNAPGRGVACGRVRLPVAATQIRQQLELRIVADRVFRATDLDTGLVELRKQFLDRYLQNLGELCNCHICHTLLRAFCAQACCSSANQCSRAFMISAAACSSSISLISSRSSVASSARSSRVTTPLLARR